MPSEELKIAARKDYLTVVKVLHFFDGMKTWNILANLDFDWMLINRNPPTWPGIIYLAERAASAACVISYMTGINVSDQIHCQAWISIAFFFPLLELELSMLLIVVRVIAIWKCITPIVFLTAMILSFHMGASVYLLTGVHAYWDPGPVYKGCVVYPGRKHLLVMSIVTMVTYVVLLGAMLTGLLRHHRQSRVFGIWPLLFQQGWIWLALAVVAEVPTLALVLADVDRSIHLLLQVPRVVIASLGTTAMFRALYNYHRQEQRGSTDLLRVRAGSGSTSRPFSGVGVPGTGSHDLKVSVNSSTMAYSDVSYQKEAF
ncbi:hypothetical protein BJV78DRAFT_1228348 [Lactifluus subvellereus]|nr:hypothetical protein BJV78DRAFT_1228348 [Lactifluus subvellereus]